MNLIYSLPYVCKDSIDAIATDNTRLSSAAVQEADC